MGYSCSPAAACADPEFAFKVGHLELSMRVGIAIGSKRVGGKVEGAAG